MQSIDQERVFFESAFKNLNIPIIVCENIGDFPVLYANTSAVLLLHPMSVTEALREDAPQQILADFLRLRNPGGLALLTRHLQESGSVDHIKINVLSHEGETLELILSANVVERPGGRICTILYFSEPQEPEKLTGRDLNNFLSNTFRLAYATDDTDEAIEQVLGYTGTFVGVDRVYIFEEISKELTSNTYEWCAPGISPEIQNLKSLPKEDYNYDAIVHGGLYITDDVSELPPEDRAILEAQGIKSLAILPLIDGDLPLGYVGYDDCHKNRVWSRMEIALLQNVAGILLSLITRRNATQQARRSLDILQRITDSTDNIVYVNDPTTYELVFVNKTLADVLGEKAENLIGKPCWSVLQQGNTGPCAFCPMRKLLDDQGQQRADSYTWEFENTRNRRWYMLRDTMIPWIDNQLMHIESGTDISHRKAYEEQLVQFASFDAMTGAYNREWGYKVMEDMRIDRRRHRPACLIFLDLDGLKQINDTYGHAEGDDMIRDSLDVIRSCIRKSDVICRWGGDEFILAVQCDLPAAQRIMDKILVAVDQFNAKAEKPYHLSFSYGIEEMDPAAPTLDALISSADEKMYAQKMGKR